MKKLFTHILVPVDFNSGSEKLLEKAIQVANCFDCDIHLLHVQTPSVVFPFVYEHNFLGSPVSGHGAEAADQLKQLVVQSKPSLANGLLITSTVAAGSWYTMIKEHVITHHIDLVVMPHHEKKCPGEVLHKVDINQLAQETKCAVLTVTDDFDAAQMHTIVVPVDDFIPIKKLSAATYLARKFGSVIHIMGNRSNSELDDRKKTRCLARVYQLLSDYANVKVYCSSEPAELVAEDALAYARNVKADLIVINSGKESLLKGWFSKWMGKYLYKESNIPVLTIAPSQQSKTPGEPGVV